jgi:hypothetical protein
MTESGAGVLIHEIALNPAGDDAAALLALSVPKAGTSRDEQCDVSAGSESWLHPG